jgi:hypothetical protein
MVCATGEAVKKYYMHCANCMSGEIREKNIPCCSTDEDIPRGD